MKAEELITCLTADAASVKRLAPPMRLAAYWLIASIIQAALVVSYLGLRPDITERLSEPHFLFETGAAVATAMFAAVAAFCAGCPGRPLWERFAPVLPISAWLMFLVYGYRSAGDEAGLLRLPADPLCLPFIVAVGFLPAMLIFWMIRRGAPLAPTSTAALASLAAAALGAAGLRLFHPQDESIMILIWQCGSVLVLTLAGAVIGRHLIYWVKPPIRAGVH